MSCTNQVHNLPVAKVAIMSKQDSVIKDSLRQDSNWHEYLKRIDEPDIEKDTLETFRFMLDQVGYFSYFSLFTIRTTCNGKMVLTNKLVLKNFRYSKRDSANHYLLKGKDIRYINDTSILIQSIVLRDKNWSIAKKKIENECYWIMRRKKAACNDCGNFIIEGTFRLPADKKVTYHRAFLQDEKAQIDLMNLLFKLWKDSDKSHKAKYFVDTILPY